MTLKKKLFGKFKQKTSGNLKTIMIYFRQEKREYNCIFVYIFFLHKIRGNFEREKLYTPLHSVPWFMETNGLWKGWKMAKDSGWLATFLGKNAAILRGQQS